MYPASQSECEQQKQSKIGEQWISPIRTNGPKQNLDKKSLINKVSDSFKLICITLWNLF